jgi:acyl-coenzyme A thioesterase PaaI-like protein
MQPTPSPAVLARRAAGKAVRDLGHALVGHHAPAELLAEVTATLGELSGRLSEGPSRSRDPLMFGSSPVGEETVHGVPLSSYDDRPFSGAASPWGLDIEVHRRGDSVEGRVTLRSAHEGAPNRSHGGIVAALFDDVFGFILGVIGEPAFTGELTVRYEKPTPLHRQLLCRGRLAERSGRKLWIEGELVDVTEPGAPVVARGRGLFIVVDRETFAQTMELPAPPTEAATPRRPV